MEKIDLNNYEAYFLDYMEGNLNAEEKVDLFTFLEMHPDLKEDFQLDFGAISLFPDSPIFENKDVLRIDESDLIITANTLPDLIIARIEKQLSDKHESQLIAYIEKHNLQALYKSYTNTILQPNLEEVFEEKNKLKVKTGWIIKMPNLKQIAAVAAVGLILITLALNWNNVTGQNVESSQARFANQQNRNHIQRNFIFNNSFVQTIDTTKSVLHDNGSNKELNNAFDKINRDIIVNLPHNLKIDSIRKEKNTPKIKDNIELVNPDNIVKHEEKDVPIEMPDIIIPQDIVTNIRREEPYKIVTEAASNIVKKDIKFTRDKDVQSNDYVSYSFKIGNFGFEHKKAK